MGKFTNIHLSLVDVDSFGYFFKANYHTACLVANRYVHDNQEAEDVVQDVFIRIWEKRDELNIHTNLKHYLLNSVRNTSINYIQRKKGLSVDLEIGDTQHLKDENDSEFLNEEFASKIDRAIENLPPRCKRIFLLAFVDNLTYQEIADTLGLSKNTVKTQMGIAYKLLREQLKDSFFNLFLLFFKPANTFLQ